MTEVDLLKAAGALRVGNDLLFAVNDDGVAAVLMAELLEKVGKVEQVDFGNQGSLANRNRQYHGDLSLASIKSSGPNRVFCLSGIDKKLAAVEIDAEVVASIAAPAFNPTIWVEPLASLR